MIFRLYREVRKVNMELLSVSLAIQILLLASLGNCLRCNDKEYAILGEDVSIDCGLPDDVDVYWYSRKTSFQTPLVKIESGGKEILRAGRDHFDISEDGALLIEDVTEDEYDEYKVVSVNQDNTYEESYVTLQAAIKPRQECPKLSLCDSCFCTSNRTDFHNLTCSIVGALPSVNLKLVADDEKILHETFTYSTNMGTFNTIAYMEYLPHKCGSTLEVLCVVTGKNMFDIKNSFMTLHSEACDLSTVELTTTEIYQDRDMLTARFLIVFCIAALVLLLITLFICCAARRCRSANRAKGTRASKEEADPDLTSAEPLLEMSSKGENSILSSKSPARDASSARAPHGKLSKDKMKTMIKHLKDRYEAMSYVRPLPWGDEVCIDELYIGTMCNVTHPQEDTKEIESTALLTLSGNGGLKRALFTAELGHGKTSLRQYLACQWSKKDFKEQMEEILFILPLKGVDLGRGIGEQLHKTLPQNLGITYEEFWYMLSKGQCHLLLDGLDELQNQTKTEDETSCVNDITVRRLLAESMLNQYPNLKLWVTSRQSDRATSLYQKPYVEVQMLGFNSTQIDEYIKKTTCYYKQIAPSSKSQSIKETFNRSYEDDVNEIQMRTRSLLDHNDLVDDFKDHPLLMVMFIHILVSRLCGITNEAYPDININKLSSLICSVMKCLEKRYLDKSKSSCTEEDLASIHNNLGKASLNDDLSLISVDAINFGKAEILKEDLTIAEEVGYIKSVRKRNMLDQKDHKFEFFHEYIQEYCIAKFIVSRGKNELINAINKLRHQNEENLRLSRILLFMCGSSNMREDILKFLIEGRHWNTLADCIYESEDEYVQTVLADKKIDWQSVKPLKLPQGITPDGKMRIVRLHKRYHQNSFKLFMAKCKKSGVRFHSLTFGPECLWEYMLGLGLPDLDILVLQKMKLDERSFINIVLWATNMKISSCIRFVGCSIPDKINVHPLQLTEVPFRIIRDYENDPRGKAEKLDIESGTWK